MHYYFSLYHEFYGLSINLLIALLYGDDVIRLFLYKRYIKSDQKQLQNFPLIKDVFCAIITSERKSVHTVL